MFFALKTQIFNVTNVQLTQSNAILRFVARKYNKALLGRTEKEEAMACPVHLTSVTLRTEPFSAILIGISLRFGRGEVNLTI